MEERWVSLSRYELELFGNALVDLLLTKEGKGVLNTYEKVMICSETGDVVFKREGELLFSYRKEGVQ